MRERASESEERANGGKDGNRKRKKRGKAGAWKTMVHTIQKRVRERANGSVEDGYNVQRAKLKGKFDKRKMVERRTHLYPRKYGERRSRAKSRCVSGAERENELFKSQINIEYGFFEICHRNDSICIHCPQKHFFWVDLKS